MTHKRNNRGFSLVELIIVIAIMAILIGVLAPAYLRYVEKSRKSADVDAIAACLNAMETVILLPEYSTKINDKTVFNVRLENGILTFTAADHSTFEPISDLTNEVSAIIGNYELKSRDWKNYADSHPGHLLIIGQVTPDGKIEFSLNDFRDNYNGTAPLLSEYSSVLEDRFALISLGGGTPIKDERGKK